MKKVSRHTFNSFINFLFINFLFINLLLRLYILFRRFNILRFLFLLLLLLYFFFIIKISRTKIPPSQRFNLIDARIEKKNIINHF